MVFAWTVADFASYLLKLGGQREKESFIVADFYVLILGRDMTGETVEVKLLFLFCQSLEG